MATDRTTDEILLNALVDGELSPAEQAAAAARLRTDRDFARAYATLTRLKADTAQFAAEDEASGIELKVPQTMRRGRVALGVAAALAMVLAAGAFVAFSPFRPESVPPRTAAPVQDNLVAVAFAGEAVIPDLSAAGLKLARTVVKASDGTQSLVATYLGPRGCRLELWINNVAAPHARRGSDRRTWQVGSLVYELVAFGMPAQRFKRVAEMAEKATRATALPDDADRLIQARIARPPCVT